VTVEIHMQGGLAPVRVMGDVDDVGATMNVATANGKSFAMFQDEDGDSIIVNMRNVLTVQNVEDEDDSIFG